MSSPFSDVILEAASVDDRQPGFCRQASDGEGISGLREDHRYRLATQPSLCALYVDDVLLTAEPDGSYRWMPALYAGRVTVTGLDQRGHAHFWWLDVSPTPGKLGQDELDAMIRDIRAWQTSLLQGTSAATLPFGMNGAPGRLEALIQLSRVMRHGPGFLTDLRAALTSPRSMLRVTYANVPLPRVRRLHPSALKDRRVAAAVAAPNVLDSTAENPLLLAQTVAISLDTPAHRAFKHLLMRFYGTVERLLRATEGAQLPEDPDEQALRRQRRLSLLSRLHTEAGRLLEIPTLREVTRPEVAATALTQIASHPAYSRAYRKGMDALRTGMEGDALNDLLHVSPTWGIYETWCYLAMVESLKSALPGEWKSSSRGICTGDIILRMELHDGKWMEAIFQAVFPSERPYAGTESWSISRERRPDILLVMHDGKTTRSMVLDAKYRSGRSNLLDAMASAHIYHDSLRVCGIRPGLCILLAPGDVTTQAQSSATFIEKHAVGMVRMCPEAATVQAVTQLVLDLAAPI